MSPTSSTRRSPRARQIFASALCTVIAGTGLFATASRPADAAPPPSAPRASTPIVAPASTRLPVATDGWVVAALGPVPKFEDGPSVLWLISPTGQRHRIGTLARDWGVFEVSNNGRRLLLQNQLTDAYAVYDTQTRTLTKVRGRYYFPRFSNPTGLALIAAQEGPDGAMHYVKTTLDGRVRLRFTTFDQPYGPLVESRDGRLVIGERKQGIAVADNASGRLVRTLPRPAGYAECMPLAMWSAREVVGKCTTADLYGTAIYSWPLTGGRPTLRAQGNGNSVPTRTMLDARPTAIGTVALVNTELASSAQVFGVMRADKQHYTPLPAPPSWWPTAVFPNRALYLNFGLKKVELHAVDLRTRRATTVAGGRTDTYGVSSLAVVDSRH